MASKTARRRTAQRPHAPDGRPSSRVLVGAVLLVVSLVAVVAVYLTRSGAPDGPGASGSSVAGLPVTPDYHSLSVRPDRPDELLLGTHDGLFRSTDAGKRWQRVALAGQDAMNIARAGAATVWVAGHEVLKRSLDGGATYQDVRPAGLPGLDVHGFAVAPDEPDRVWAAVAGQGLYRSDDGGHTFAVVSTAVGPAVMALAELPGGRMLAGDMQQGLLASDDGGATFRPVLRAAVMGLAVNPGDPQILLAGGQGIARSVDGGRTWHQVQDAPAGVGPVAWAPSQPSRGYAVGLDRTLYRTDDHGASWDVVEAPGSPQ